MTWHLAMGKSLAIVKYFKWWETQRRRVFFVWSKTQAQLIDERLVKNLQSTTGLKRKKRFHLHCVDEGFKTIAIALIGTPVIPILNPTNMELVPCFAAVTTDTLLGSIYTKFLVIFAHSFKLEKRSDSGVGQEDLLYNFISSSFQRCFKINCFPKVGITWLSQIALV